MKKILSAGTARESAAAAAPRKPRGRPRSFDRAAALDAAMQVFWEKGFESASLADLTKAMGINPPSLYAAFGDKEALFLEALERYQSRGTTSCPYVDEPTARASIERLLRYVATDLSSPEHPRGCMMALSVATTNTGSPRFQRALAERRAAGRARMKARIEQGIRDGDVPPGTDAEALAHFYATVVSGLSMQARDGATRKRLLATVEQALALFPPAPASARKRPEKQAA